MWGFSIQFWEDVFKWSTLGAFVFGGIGVISAFISAWVGYHITDTAQRDADRKIAEAHAQVAKAHLEQERLKEKIAWRRLTAEQHDILVSMLKGHPMKVWTSFVGDDPEAATFRDDIDRTLQEAGIKTQYFSGWKVAVGLQITDAPGQDHDLLVAAFEKAGMPIVKVPAQKMFLGELGIIVGSKPPPF